jgi:hypothetical protein
MNRNEKLLRKHRPMSNKDIENKILENKEIKKEFSTDATVLKANLQKFNQITDPLVDPESGLELCWIRRPTAQEFEALIPSELLEYRNSPDAIPKEVADKHENFQFEMMEKLIVNPIEDWKYWKANSNQVFQFLFNKHLNSLLEKLGIDVQNF